MLFHSVAQSCLNLQDPMNCSTPGSPVLTVSWGLPKVMSIESLMLSNHLILCHPLLLCLQSFPASGSFPMSWFFTSDGQSIVASASTSVFPMNIQHWFPLGWTGLIFSLSKELSRVFSTSSTKIWKHQLFRAQLSLWSYSHILT